MPFIFSGEVKDKTENDKAAGTRFYGPPSNWNELGKLGYTLNGYLMCTTQNLRGQI